MLEKCTLAKSHQTFGHKPYCSGNTFCLCHPELAEGFYVSEHMFRQAQHDKMNSIAVNKKIAAERRAAAAKYISLLFSKSI
jgi:hypothetical protein